MQDICFKQNNLSHKIMLTAVSIILCNKLLCLTETYILYAEVSKKSKTSQWMYYAIIFQKGQSVFKQTVQPSQSTEACYSTTQKFDIFNKNLTLAWSKFFPIKLFSNSDIQVILLLYGNTASITIFKWSWEWSLFTARSIQPTLSYLFNLRLF